MKIQKLKYILKEFQIPMKEDKKEKCNKFQKDFRFGQINWRCLRAL